MTNKIVNKQMILSVVLLLVSNVVFAASIGTGGLSAAFSKGNVNLGIVAGSGQAFREDYIILGVGVGYYVLNGLELGVDVQHWFSGDPAITKISPQIKYVFTQPKTIKPYVGVFYRTTFIEDLDNESSYGYRAGAFFSGGNGVYVGGGIVYEEYEDCSRFVDCSNTYPEIIISVSF
ncbi:MAG: hypothetical protein COA54_07310 [Thiotrichaceae bacterium]|nr:MAG: hypothetical protein COA54_07310 [Thiotrichaceae bacterium]